MSPWSQWSDCYGDCDGYTSQKRSRNIVTEAKYGGTCQELDQKAKCDEKVNFEAWSEWTTCSQNCGDGTQTRSRVTQKHFNEKIDIECSDEKACFGDACLEDCRLSKWEAVSSCIGDCAGKGIRNMSRMVIEEAKSGGDPWIFYMTEEFIKRCLQLADDVLDAFAALVKSLEEQNK